MKPVAMLPNLLTLGNSACGLLAICKGLDALAYSSVGSEVFYMKMEAACGLIFLGMVFDALDGKVARLTKSFSDFGAQLDSLSDALTFGVAPAILAKVLIEHEGPLVGHMGSPRLHFIAAGAFSLMAILRLARFNLETEHDEEAHRSFSGLPSPGAAGAVTSTLLMYLLFREPSLETENGTPTPVGHVMGWLQGIDWTPVLSWVPVYLVVLLPLLGLLMVSRVRYTHATSLLTRDRSNFVTLVAVVFVFMGLGVAPVPFLFLAFNGFWLFGAVRWALGALRARGEARQGSAQA
ncbi:MAG: CDP-alcohol phosphatidyltransferase family protein [Planctomycetes bacterium]|nr:CDP-alcohol phosphatidyltransferase family protein [Planctomycetota bacterium]